MVKTCNIAIQLQPRPQGEVDSTRFAAMLQNKLHVFCCPFFRTLRIKIELNNLIYYI